jgi:hypothetical protein
MIRGKDALFVLAALAVQVAFSGCMGESPLRLLHADRAARRQQAVTAGIPPLNPPPMPVAESREIVPASAQMPDAPPNAVAPPVPSGAPLTSETSLPATPAASLRQLHRLAAERYSAIDSYIVRLRRREQVNGKDNPEELILFKFRKVPWSIYFKWLGQEGAGREVIYVKGQHDNKIHTLLAAGDVALFPAGKRMALAPDSLLVRSASRHSITEAGVGTIIDRLGEQIEAQEKGDRRSAAVTYLGGQRRPEFAGPLDAVELVLPPGYEPSLPRGGRRWIFFDPKERLPVLVITHDERGHEVEYYCYDRLQCPVRLDDDDFNPDKLWSKPKATSKAVSGSSPQKP